jgi:fucose 4-O-acetylase-like acetyltransferase
MSSRAVIYYFHMPLFFVLSGLTTRLDTEFGPSVWKRFRRLIVPYYFFSLYAIGKIVLKLLSPAAFDSFHGSVMQGGVQELLKILFGEAEGLWFFWALFWGDLMLWAINRFLGRKGIIFLVPVALVMWRLLIAYPVSLPFQLPLAFEAAAFTAIGFLLSQRILHLGIRDVQIRIIFSAIVFAGAAWIFHTLSGESVFATMLPAMLAAVSGSFMIIYVSMLMPTFRWLSYVGRNTIVFYGLNGLSLALARVVVFHILSTRIVSSMLILQLLSGVVVIALACGICSCAEKIISRWMWWAIGARPRVRKSY